MAEVLEIQIQDRGQPAAPAGPPRPPEGPTALPSPPAVPLAPGAVQGPATPVAAGQQALVAPPISGAPAAAAAAAPAVPPRASAASLPAGEAAASAALVRLAASAQTASSALDLLTGNKGPGEAEKEAKKPAESPAGLGAQVAGAGVAAAIVTLTAAFGPAGTALGAVAAAALETRTAFEATRKSLEGFGSTLASAAGNDFMGTVKTLGGGLGSLVGDIPVVGSAFKLAGTGVSAFTETVSAFNRRAGELAGFSPEIMAAQIQQTIGGLLGDLKEAQELGPEMGRLLQAETAAQHEMREIWLPIKKFFLGVMADVMEAIAEWIRDTRAFFSVEFWETLFSEFGEALKPWADKTMAEASDNVSRKFDELKQAFEQEREKDFPDLEHFLRGLYETPAPPLAPRAPAPDGRPRIPLVEAFRGL